jgi:hypothetical protein
MAVLPQDSRQGPLERVTVRGDRGTATGEDICNRAFPALFCPRRYTMGGARCGAMPSSDIVEVRATVSAARFGQTGHLAGPKSLRRGPCVGIWVAARWADRLIYLKTVSETRAQLYIRKAAIRPDNRG